MCAATPERVMPHQFRKLVLADQRILLNPRQNLLFAIGCGHLFPLALGKIHEIGVFQVVLPCGDIVLNQLVVGKQLLGFRVEVASAMGLPSASR